MTGRFPTFPMVPRTKLDAETETEDALGVGLLQRPDFDDPVRHRAGSVRDKLDGFRQAGCLDNSETGYGHGG